MMQYIFTGFTHDVGFRVFAFEGVGKDQTRTVFKVKTDLALIRRYGIRVQELPLLCRGILERRDESEQRQSFTYTEADMCLRAGDRAASAAASPKRKSPRKQPSESAGAAWRDPLKQTEPPPAPMEAV